AQHHEADQPSDRFGQGRGRIRGRHGRAGLNLMGQKVNPTGFRVGISEDWKSKWFAPKSAYGEFLVEDYKIRTLIDRQLNRQPPFAAVSDVIIERTREEVTVTLKTA